MQLYSLKRKLRLSFCSFLERVLSYVCKRGRPCESSEAIHFVIDLRCLRSGPTHLLLRNIEFTPNTQTLKSIDVGDYILIAEMVKGTCAFLLLFCFVFANGLWQYMRESVVRSQCPQKRSRRHKLRWQKSLV